MSLFDQPQLSTRHVEGIGSTTKIQRQSKMEVIILWMAKDANICKGDVISWIDDDKICDDDGMMGVINMWLMFVVMSS